jgi:hypothetical protein
MTALASRACERSGSGLKCRSTLHQFFGLPLTAPFPFPDLPLRAPLRSSLFSEVPLTAPLTLISFSARSAPFSAPLRLFLRRNCYHSSPVHSYYNMNNRMQCIRVCKMQPLIISIGVARIFDWGSCELTQ